MEDITQSFNDFFSRLKAAAPEIAVGLAIFILFVFIGLLAGRGLKKLLSRTRLSPIKTQLMRRLTRWGFYLIGLTIALNIMGLTKAASSILAAGGILTVVLGFAFREIGENLLAGFFMSFSRSFDVGDLIESNGIRGIVRQINIRDVHVRAADGIDIFIPSAMIYKNPLHNFTRDGLRRTSFVIGIDYRDDLAQAQKLVLNSLCETEGIIEVPAPTVQASNFTANYIELEVFFWINTFSEHADLSAIRTSAMEQAKQVLLEHDYTLSSEVSSALDVNLKRE